MQSLQRQVCVSGVWNEPTEAVQSVHCPFEARIHVDQSAATMHPHRLHQAAHYTQCQACRSLMIFLPTAAPCASLLALTFRNAEPEVLGAPVADSLRTRVDGALCLVRCIQYAVGDTATPTERRKTTIDDIAICALQTAIGCNLSSTKQTWFRYAAFRAGLIGDTQRTTVTRTLWRWRGGNVHGGPVLQYELSTNLSNTLEFDGDELQCIED